MSDRGGHGHFRYDAITAELSLAYLREARPDFLFVSLGETDEQAHAGHFTEYLRKLQQADAFIGEVRRDLKQLRRSGRPTLLLVTTDHGRSYSFNHHGRKYPESARSFLFAEGTHVRPQGRVVHPKAYLKDIAPTVRLAAGLPHTEVEGGGRVLRELLGT